MADDNVIIEGNVKFRDGKKWKSRWCVMRKLSPVADCVQLQVWRDGRARLGAGVGCSNGGSGCKAALALQQYVGCECGFTLDKHSNTLALLCTDLVAVLAFDTRERLMQWQVKVSLHLGPSREYLVLVSRWGSGRGRAGPARLHIAQRRAALVAGSPPAIVAAWELHHLRRYGVVEGRVCLEGGSRCARGAGAGLYVLAAERAAAADIARDLDRAARAQLHRHRAAGAGTGGHADDDSSRSNQSFRPGTRLSELQEAATPGDLAEEPWPSAEGMGDSASMCGPSGGGSVALARCRSCMSKLGAMSRSSTAALTPGAKHFNPNWTMDQPTSLSRSVSGECSCLIPATPTDPTTPPRPPRKPLPGHACRTAVDTMVGPYENYDVPKLPSAEVDGEYYDTPKRLKEFLNEDLFKLTKSSTPNSLVLKKPCGCLLQFGRSRREPNVVEEEEALPAPCACRRVTAWAQGWLSRRAPSALDTSATPAAPAIPAIPTITDSSAVLPGGKENMKPSVSEHSALYAMIDLSRKTRRKSPLYSNYSKLEPCPDSRSIQIDDGPLANYENLNFALSLEHYENAKDLLKSAGLTGRELNALSLSLHAPARTASCGTCGTCGTCGRSPRDEYLFMAPNRREAPAAGYTPMSPVGLASRTLGWSHAPRPRPRPASLLEEKSASNPALCAVESAEVYDCERESAREWDRRCEGRKRSSSADSSRFLDEVEDSGAGSRTSIDTLLAAGEERVAGGAAGRGDMRVGSRAAGVRRAASVPAACRDSSSSNDSGVSVCSGRAAPRPAPAPRPGSRVGPAPPRRARSTDPLQERAAVLVPAKSSSAEAEVPVLTRKTLRTASSSGASDMSDYLETLSLCSSRSSSDAPATATATATATVSPSAPSPAPVNAPLHNRAVRQTTSTLRPRSGKEYLPASGVTTAAATAGATATATVTAIAARCVQPSAGAVPERSHYRARTYSKLPIPP